MRDGGYCECGCGELAPISKQNNKPRGYVKGQPKRFIQGHGCKRPGPVYIEEDRGYTTPCWVWQGELSGKGYGRTYRGKRYQAHRLFYERTYGPIPDGLQLDHLCRVKACVRPIHLEAVTQIENQRRAAKLTAEDVAAIRSDQFTAREAAARFDIREAYVRMIRNYKRWPDVT